MEWQIEVVSGRCSESIGYKFIFGLFKGFELEGGSEEGPPVPARHQGGGNRNRRRLHKYNYDLIPNRGQGR
jgi:hypothetical protein